MFVFYLSQFFAFYLVRLLILPCGSFLCLSVQKDPKDRSSAQDLLVWPMKPFEPFQCWCYKFAGLWILPIWCGFLFLFPFLFDFRHILSSTCTTTWILTLPLTSVKQDLPSQHFKTYLVCLNLEFSPNLGFISGTEIQKFLTFP